MSEERELRDMVLIAGRYENVLRMNLRTSFVGLVAVCVLASPGRAQATASASNLVGVWRGTSVCQVPPSPCNDENVVYRITRVKATDSISVDACKIVNAQERGDGRPCLPARFS
jgi:hypothetical protein